MESKLLVPIGLAVCVALVVCVRLWMRQRQQAQAQETVRRLVEKGIELTPELIRSLGVKPPSSDLKRGMLYLAVAVGCVIFGVLDAYEDGTTSSVLTFLGIAAFPALIGLTLVAFHVLNRAKR